MELTLNRPEAMNAFTEELHGALGAALRDAQKPDVRALIITGAGRAFCAGQDLGEAEASAMPLGERLERFYNPNIRALRRLEKPVIAAVNGVAAGAGLGLALACDLRIAGRRAGFVPAFVAIGLIPDSGASWFAPRILGEARAYDWLISNRKLGAEEALEWNLVNEVVEPEHVLPRARELAAALVALPGNVAGLTKRLVTMAATASLDEQLEVERQLQQSSGDHPSYAERVAAIRSKGEKPTDRSGAVLR
jgi:2-(1,2-epoxy-1,2-dihydrophenyl)acetyl-CoA isomerase